jgi:hypothetical protein
MNHSFAAYQAACLAADQGTVPSVVAIVLVIVLILRGGTARHVIQAAASPTLVASVLIAIPANAPVRPRHW